MAIASAVRTVSIRFHSVKPEAGVIRRDWRTGLPGSPGSVGPLRELRASDAHGAADRVWLAGSDAPDFAAAADARGVREVRRVDAAAARSGGSRSRSALRSTTAIPSSACSRSGRSSPGFDIAEWGFALSSEHWGSGLFHGSRRTRARFRVRRRRRASARGARGAQERARQRRPAEARRDAGRRPAPVVSAKRRVSRSGALDDPRRRSAQRDGRFGRTI